jgi:hypothetical protein
MRNFSRVRSPFVAMRGAYRPVRKRRVNGLFITRNCDRSAVGRL